MFVLRVGKAIAMVCNAGTGWMFLGWRMGESKILDFVGRETIRTFSRFYGRELNRDEVSTFINRRLYWCFVTGVCTALQIIFSVILPAPRQRWLRTCL